MLGDDAARTVLIHDAARTVLFHRFIQLAEAMGMGPTESFGAIRKLLKSALLAMDQRLASSAMRLVLDDIQNLAEILNPQPQPKRSHHKTKPNKKK